MTSSKKAPQTLQAESLLRLKPNPMTKTFLLVKNPVIKKFHVHADLSKNKRAIDPHKAFLR